MIRYLLLAALLFAAHANAVVLRPGGSGASSASCTGTTNQIAACQTAANNGVCTVLGDYYAEIGNASGPLWSYQQGASINRYSLEQLDSGTKFIDGAYWVQTRGGVNNLTADDVLHLHQQSGMVNQPSSCPANSTVISCLATTPGVNAIISLGSITNGGSGYTTGTHKANLTNGTGSGATATLTVNGSGVVTGVSLLANGNGYLVGDVLSSKLGGGSGLAIAVTDTTCYPATGYTVGGVAIAANAYGGVCTGNQGVFFYNGGEFQSQAVIDGGSGFYNLTKTGLANAFNTELGTPTFTASSSNGSATFTNTGNNGLATGMHVYLSGSIPTGFTGQAAGGPVYYVTNVNAAPTATTFQLSLAKCTQNKINGPLICGTAVVPSSSSSGVTITVMPLTFSMPLIAGGGNWSAGGLAVFLENVLNGSLLFQGALGAYEVTPNYPGNGEAVGGTDGTYCAYTVGGNSWPAQVLHGTVFGSPFAATTVTCGGGGTTVNAIGYSGSPPNGPWILNGISQAQGSPISQNFKYGVAHWVISDPVVHGDGAFCGIGSKGVDICIDSTTDTIYTMLVRVGPPGSGGRSNACDNLLRHAYQTGVQQTGAFPTG